MSLQDFSSLLIRSGVDGGVLQAKVLNNLRQQTIRSLKNFAGSWGQHGNGGRHDWAGSMHSRVYDRPSYLGRAGVIQSYASCRTASIDFAPHSGGNADVRLREAGV